MMGAYKGQQWPPFEASNNGRALLLHWMGGGAWPVNGRHGCHDNGGALFTLPAR